MRSVKVIHVVGCHAEGEVGDVIVGAPLGSDGGTYSGQAYVVLGKASGFGTLDASGRSIVDVATLAPTDGFVVRGARFPLRISG